MLESKLTSKLKVGFIGCVESSRRALLTLLTIEDVEIVAVVTKDSSPVNSDFSDLSSICIDNEIPYCIYSKGLEQGVADFFKTKNVDIIYCIGWSHLLSEEIINVAPKGVIGFHPAKLPRNRGRHPIIWTLVLGLEETASTFFKMDLGADSGPIIDQKVLKVGVNDNAQSLYNKIMNLACEQILSFTKDLVNGVEVFSEQGDGATYWRKRSKIDGVIDWRMSAKSIYDLVRALSSPYPGAEFEVNEKLYKVTNATPVYGGYLKDIEPGYILERDVSEMLIKVSGDDAIWLHDLECDTSIFGAYI